MGPVIPVGPVLPVAPAPPSPQTQVVEGPIPVEEIAIILTPEPPCKVVLLAGGKLIYNIAPVLSYIDTELVVLILLITIQEPVLHVEFSGNLTLATPVTLNVNISNKFELVNVVVPEAVIIALELTYVPLPNKKFKLELLSNHALLLK